MTDPGRLSAASVLERLSALANPDDVPGLSRFFKAGPGEYGEGDTFIGVRRGPLTALAKEFLGMPVGELESLLRSEIHEARAAALAIMSEEGRRKRTSPERRRELFELYLRRHDRINNWDLVDSAAPYVVGGYLEHRPRDILYELARSPVLWERRTAMVATWYFIRSGDLDDAFAMAALLLDDDHDLIHKATGWMLRSAGQMDRARLVAFLDTHAATMPRTALRYAIEKFSPADRAHFLALKPASRAGSAPPAQPRLPPRFSGGSAGRYPN
ncbi:DNA alkylation repair protein [Lacisediminihabitans profunda]|uniref:DNA alkylation repair protein n=1 Tax=Lacisediminihabitans profunda TaxID=2594790 RepID=A0A5C8UWB1_9MICO|nr:DNA alkylation repair protein [Lacisediminihabitans profunda]TXN32323.1 DNA alkylation repair protein [Lacisediminihabitans profunda]